MLLQNGKVLQFNSLHMKFEKLDIRIHGAMISEIGSCLIPDPGEEVLDLKEDYVLPGMVNSHYHSYTNLLKGTSFGEPLEIWSADTVALGSVLTNVDMELSTSLGICKMLRAGVTACVDHLPHLGTAHTAAIAYKNSGFKAALAPMVHNIRDCDYLYGFKDRSSDKSPSGFFPSIQEYIDYYEDFIHNYQGPYENIRVMVGINSPQRADSELLEACSYLSHRYNLPVHCHLLETKWQRLTADHQVSPLLQLNRFDLLDKNTSLAHCLWLKENELDMISEKKSMVISNPTSNYFLGSGMFLSKQFMKRNIPISLGSDGANCGTNHNMLEILRFFLLNQRIQEPDFYNWITLEDGYRMVTQNGCNVLNFPQKFGEIKPTCSADLVIADKSVFLDIIDGSLPRQLIFNTSQLSPKHIFINGQFCMKNKKIIGIDEESLIREIAERVPYLKKNMNQALLEASKNKQLYEAIYTAKVSHIND